MTTSTSATELNIEFCEVKLSFAVSNELVNYMVDIAGVHGVLFADKLLNLANKYNQADALNSDTAGGHIIICAGRYVEELKQVAKLLLKHAPYKTEYDKIKNRYSNLSIYRGKEKLKTMLSNRGIV